MQPYFFRRFFLAEPAPRLGGSWTSLVAANLGGVFLWASIFVEPLSATLHGIAYALWAVAAVPVAIELWRIAGQGLAQLEPAGERAAEAPTD